MHAPVKVNVAYEPAIVVSMPVPLCSFSALVKFHPSLYLILGSRSSIENRVVLSARTRQGMSKKMIDKKAIMRGCCTVAKKKWARCRVGTICGAFSSIISFGFRQNSRGGNWLQFEARVMEAILQRCIPRELEQGNVNSCKSIMMAGLPHQTVVTLLSEKSYIWNAYVSLAAARVPAGPHEYGAPIIIMGSFCQCGAAMRVIRITSQWEQKYSPLAKV